MIRRLRLPHLPEGNVRQIIIGEKYRKLLEKALSEYNIEAFWLKSNPYVDSRLSGHADLSAAHVGDTVLLAEYLTDSENVNKLIDIGYSCRFVRNCESKYPGDAGLNFCLIGNRLIADPRISLFEAADGVKLISVRQGYTKCSVCVVDENSIITSDKRIGELCLKDGMNVLIIDKPFVELEGFGHGFIGGASFKLSKSKLAFTGVIRNNDIRNRIEGFLSQQGIEAVYLTEKAIFDIGSAIPLTEEL